MSQAKTTTDHDDFRRWADDDIALFHEDETSSGKTSRSAKFVSRHQED